MMVCGVWSCNIFSLPPFLPPSFPPSTPSAVDYHHELQELRSSHADTISELEKTRKLLALQHTINKDYKKEVSDTLHDSGHQDVQLCP